MRRAVACRASLLVLSMLLSTGWLAGETIPVAHKEGTLRGFLRLSDDHGRRIADGDLTQVVRGDRVTARLLFRFRDGSVDDDVSVFSQNGVFKLLHDHHVQKGPSFPHPVDVDIDMAAQQVKALIEKDGRAGTETQHMDLPEDVSNGMPLMLVKSISPQTKQTKVTYVASTPKVRLVHLLIAPGAARNFSIGHRHYKAACFVFHVELGGITGVVAPLVGKQPADGRVWVVEGPAPAFVRADLPLYAGGPIWSIQMAAPVW